MEKNTNRKFSDFVLTLPEYVIRKVVWDKYFYVKNDTGRVLNLGLQGGSLFMTICLLQEYSVMEQLEKLIQECELLFYYAFQYIPDNLLQDKVEKLLKETLTKVSYQDFCWAKDKIKKDYAKWLSDMEFYRGKKDFPYEERYEKFKNEIADSLENLEDIQKSADGLGIKVHLLKENFEAADGIKKYFKTLEEDAVKKTEGYEDFSEKELYSVYKDVAVAAYKTDLILKITQKLSAKLGYFEQCRWQETLKLLKKSANEIGITCGRILFGDDNRTQCVFDNFVHSGQFELLLMFNDTSMMMNGSEGFVVTTKRIYYKSKFSSGDIPINEVTNFQFVGGTWKQKLYLYTDNGKKYQIPYKVGEKEHYHYLELLEKLIQIAKMQDKNFPDS